MKPKTLVKTLFFLMITLVFTGCVGLPTGGIEPLEERVLEGEGTSKVLLIDISGVIHNKEVRNILGVKAEPRLTARVKEELMRAEEDSNIKAVILRINSPGGSVTPCDIIHHEIEEFKKRTGIPVIAHMMEVAASGGLYIALAADTIYAHPTSVTGSVGVIAYRADITGLLKKIGIEDDTIKSGDKKDIGSPLRSLTDEERAIMQEIIDSMQSRFFSLVKEARPNMSEAALMTVSDGRVFTAPMAKGLGLIDGLGYMEDSFKSAKKAAGLDKARLVTYSRPASNR